MRIGPVLAALALLSLSPALAGCTNSAPAQEETTGGHMLSAEDAWIRMTSTPWRLEEIGGAPILPGTKVTIRFAEDGRISGSGGVNSYFGSTERTGAESLEFSPIGATQMYGGDPPGIMEQEQAYFQALQSVDGFRVKGDRLQLLSDGTAVLTFEPDDS